MTSSPPVDRDDDVFVVLCTAPADSAVQARLARGLVDGRLAACVNVIPKVRSFYRWEGEVHDDEEAQLLIKTTRARLDDVVAHLHAQHPYDVPEVLALRVAEGGDAYLAWVAGETRRPADPR
ncbi:MAG: divalent-cation tolerance protein CutA [Myxococcota bacterium]